MDSIKQKLLEKVSRMEQAANRGIKCSADPKLAQEPGRIISQEQCNWTLQDCRAFREMINECFGSSE